MRLRRYRAACVAYDARRLELCAILRQALRRWRLDVDALALESARLRVSSGLAGAGAVKTAGPEPLASTTEEKHDQ